MCATGCSSMIMRQALTLVLERGRVGETYNIGGDSERRNIDVVNAICDAMDKLAPNPQRQAASRIDHLCRRPSRPRFPLRDRLLRSSRPNSAGSRGTHLKSGLLRDSAMVHRQSRLVAAAVGEARRRQPPRPVCEECVTNARSSFWRNRPGRGGDLRAVRLEAASILSRRAMPNLI